MSHVPPAIEVRDCPTCGAPFVVGIAAGALGGHTSRAIYCSRRCTHSAGERRGRVKRRVKETTVGKKDRA